MQNTQDLIVNPQMTVQPLMVKKALRPAARYSLLGTRFTASGQALVDL